jgi:hypothetical protein
MRSGDLLIAADGGNAVCGLFEATGNANADGLSIDFGATGRLYQLHRQCERSRIRCRGCPFGQRARSAAGQIPQQFGGGSLQQQYDRMASASSVPRSTWVPRQGSMCGRSPIAAF